jgi:hypothetical protein
MKDSFTFYGIILASIYVGFYIWNQKEVIADLDQVTIKQYDQLMECRDLIKVQRQYIDLLEADYYSPLHKPISPPNRGPI